MSEKKREQSLRDRMFEEEYQRCTSSPCYFYNTYVRPKYQRELTEEQYRSFVEQVEYRRRMGPLKPRANYKDYYPLLPATLRHPRPSDSD